MSPGLDRRLLATYLNDHLAGATAGHELVRRSPTSSSPADSGSARRS